MVTYIMKLDEIIAQEIPNLAAQTHHETPDSISFPQIREIHNRLLHCCVIEYNFTYFFLVVVYNEWLLHVRTVISPSKHLHILRSNDLHSGHLRFDLSAIIYFYRHKKILRNISAYFYEEFYWPSSNIL